MSHGSHTVRPYRLSVWFHMNRMALSAWMLLVTSAALTSDEVRAQGRGASVQEIHEQARQVDQEAARVAKLAELDVWLRRMIGRYSIEGELRLDAGYFTLAGTYCPKVAGMIAEDECHLLFLRNARGVGDCVGVGNGPGVHCVLNVPWPRFIRDTPLPNRPIEEKWLGRGQLDPAMLMFGIDPDRPGIRYLLVDGQSQATEATGNLQGDTVTYNTDCPKDAGSGAEMTGCHKRFWIRIHPDSGNMSIGMDMRNSYKKIASYSFQLKRVPDDQPLHPPETPLDRR